MKKYLVFLFSFVLTIQVNSQEKKTDFQKVYSLNYKWELPFTASMFAFNIYGFYSLGNKPTLSLDKINSLDQEDVCSFDRKVFSQTHPAPSGIYDIMVLYMETQAINLNVYLWGGAVFTKRIRPLVYMENQSLDYKLDKETTDSFFSGHVSMVTGATFFMAKVLSDYHPELGSKKMWLYGAALVPPAIMSYWRYRGFMHFPSDLLIGASVGATVGIAVPQFHRITNKFTDKLTIVPFAGKYSGIFCSVEF